MLCSGISHFLVISDKACVLKRAPDEIFTSVVPVLIYHNSSGCWWVVFLGLGRKKSSQVLVGALGLFLTEFEYWCSGEEG